MHALAPLQFPAAPTCAVLVERIGPYHFARLTALAARMRTVAIEWFSLDNTYAWSKLTQRGDFERHTLLEKSGGREEQDRRLMQSVPELLSRIAPSVVAIPGWSEKSALAALKWCLQTGTPSLVLSASFEEGKPRTRYQEAVKRRIVRLFSAGLGGGTQQTNYLARLGIPPERIFRGYDVVDNVHFAVQSDAAREDAARLRLRLGLPQNFFLTICRFIEEKNLLTLIEAYSAYRRVAGERAWKLVLLGDGPLKPALLERREQFGLSEDLLIPGFKQYQELPFYYGLAGAFVLPSLTEPWGLVINEAMAAGLPILVSDQCGCAADLVQSGRNGFTFDPRDPAQISSLLARISEPGTDRAAMGQASREIIEQWSPDVFAANLQRAVQAAYAAPRRTLSVIDRLLFWLLLRR